MVGGTEQGGEHTRFHRCQQESYNSRPNALARLHTSICDHTPVDRHGEHTPKIMSFMKACNGHT